LYFSNYLFVFESTRRVFLERTRFLSMLYNKLISVAL